MDTTAELREYIRRYLQPGDHLEDSAHLAHAFGVAQATIRTAQDALVTEGVLQADGAVLVVVNTPRADQAEETR